MIDHNFIFDELYKEDKNDKRETVVIPDCPSRTKDFTFEEIEKAIKEQAEEHLKMFLESF